jgi:thiosulfate/3-mercaptopyruvate sulfurtransferase
VVVLLARLISLCLHVIDPVVDIDWWRAHRDAVVTADVRWYLDGRSGAQEYAAGHLPGAVFVDLDAALATLGEPAAGRHPLPAPEAFAAAMSELGIGDDSVVVAYDDSGGTTAARLVWMLRVTGHEAALLDGGIGAHAGALEPGAGSRPAGAVFTPRPWPVETLASMDDAADVANVVLDARAAPRYRGETEPVDPQAGHIPGARNLPAPELLSPDGRFLPPGELRERFAAAGVAEPGFISYCGSGVVACHLLLAAEHAGLGPGRLFPGSWSAWSNTPGRPVER